MSGVVIAAPTAIVAGGSYTSTQAVTLTSTGSLSVRYTTDGSAPTCTTGTEYTSALVISSTVTVNAIACYANGVSSPVSTNVYVITAAGTTGGSGGGGGGGGGGSTFVSASFVPSTSATTTVVTTTFGTTGSATTTVRTGTVLGVASRVFLINLRFGSQGKDVQDLQQFLIDQGFLKLDKTTLRFGLATRSALIAFQKKNGITPAVGFFGPTTRAAVNAIIAKK